MGWKRSVVSLYKIPSKGNIHIEYSSLSRPFLSHIGSATSALENLYRKTSPIRVFPNTD